MGLIIEIILTIVAWNRGWKWLALIPLGVGVLLGLIIGLIGGSMGSTAEDLSWVVVFDAIVIIALIIMCFVKPKSAEVTATKSETPIENKPEAPAEKK
jgi:hypothetical protein